MGNFGVGQAVRRVEDKRFLTGTGQFTDDITVPGQLHVYFLRSSYAHAEIRPINAAAAKAAPGVKGILTGEDLQALGIGDIPCEAIPPGKDGAKPKAPPRPALA